MVLRLMESWMNQKVWGLFFNPGTLGEGCAGCDVGMLCGCGCVYWDPRLVLCVCHEDEDQKVEYNFENGFHSEFLWWCFFLVFLSFFRNFAVVLFSCFSFFLSQGRVSVSTSLGARH